MPRPLISIIIPCYNHASYLPEAIDSVLGQTYPHREAIVIDDGSTDETPRVAARYADQIQYIRQENAGLSAARNTGIRHARGELLNFLDADDFLYPDTLARHVNIAESRPDVAVFYGGARMMRADGKVEQCFAPPNLPSQPLLHLLRCSPLPCHTVVLRRAVVDRIGNFDETLAAAEDWDFWIRAAAVGFCFAPVPGALVAYRRHPATMSRDTYRIWSNGLRVLRRYEESLSRQPGARKALAEGRQWLRRHCGETVLAAQLEYLLARGRIFDAWRQMQSAARCHPTLPFYAAVGLARRMVDRLRAGLPRARSAGRNCGVSPSRSPLL